VLVELTIESTTHRMLLTGDARGDFIWDGLIQAGFIRDRDDKVNFDLIKNAASWQQPQYDARVSRARYGGSLCDFGGW